jgi:hypothetical protein
MLRRTVQPARTLIGMVARRQMSSMEGVFGAAAKALDTEVPGLTPAQLAGRYNGKLEALNEWILGEERDYLASKGESKSLDDVTGAAPLKLYGVAGRYATGLYNSAVKAKELGKVDTDIKKLVSAANSSASVMNFIASPTVGRADRLKGIEGVSQALGLCTTTKNFLGVLAASSRTKFLMAIADNLSQLTAAASGEQTVTLTAPRVRAVARGRACTSRDSRPGGGRRGGARKATAASSCSQTKAARRDSRARGRAARLGASGRGCQMRSGAAGCPSHTAHSFSVCPRPQPRAALSSPPTCAIPPARAPWLEIAPRTFRRSLARRCCRTWWRSRSSTTSRRSSCRGRRCASSASTTPT